MTEKKLPPTTTPSTSASKDWHGIPRDTIKWHPTVEPELCIGCGICVLGCGPGVFEFNYETNKSEVKNPLKCKVGCVTCANTCPTHAIGFPPLSYLHKIVKDKNVIQFSKKEINLRK
jgi:CDP-4-dehydro-6-deoxyglucose reductase, E3